MKTVTLSTEAEIQYALKLLQEAHDLIESLMTNENLKQLNQWPLPPNWGLVHHVMDNTQQNILILQDEFSDIT